MRWIAIAAPLAALVVGAAAGTAGGQRTASCPIAVTRSGDLGRLAFVDRGRLELLDVATCRSRTLVARGAESAVRWSADGRYLAYGAGSVILAAGRTAARPLGRLAPGWGSGSPGWVWSPTGHRLAGVTVGGGVVVGGPGARRKRLLPESWGATSIAWSPNGRTLAVTRSLYPASRPPYHQEIWVLDPSSGAKKMLFHLPRPELAPPWLSGFSPDGHWILAWEDSQNSSSLAADGLPLVAVPVKGGRAVPIGTGTLVYGDFVSWCSGNLLAYVLNNGGREVTLHDRINLAGPGPRWAVVTPGNPGAKAQLSFVSPACSPSNELEVAAAVGPAAQNESFGHEHRAIWLLPSAGGNWRPLETAPPKGSSDELPLWSSDGHWIAFIRTTSTRASGIGRLYLLQLGTNGRAAHLFGPIADVGVTSNDYGHYDWAAQIAWYNR